MSDLFAALFALALILSPIILIGGGAALGWFVLPLAFGREAIIPFTVGGAVLGGALLFGLKSSHVHL